jgi:hypothetical protein
MAVILIGVGLGLIVGVAVACLVGGPPHGTWKDEP